MRKPQNFGIIADNMSVLISAAIQLLALISLITGCMLVVSAGLKFRLHWKKPQQMPIGKPITELILALVLIALPLLTGLMN